MQNRAVVGLRWLQPRQSNSSAAPQLMQNLAIAGLRLPQFRHGVAIAMPQCMQKLATAGLSPSHAGQRMISL
jgi:hypothetical protein